MEPSVKMSLFLLHVHWSQIAMEVCTTKTQVGPKKQNWESLWAPFTDVKLVCRHNAPTVTEEVCEEATNCIDDSRVLVRAAGCLSVSFSWAHNLHSTAWTTCILFFDTSLWNTNLWSCISLKTNKQKTGSTVNCMVERKKDETCSHCSSVQPGVISGMMHLSTVSMLGLEGPWEHL